MVIDDIGGKEKQQELIDGKGKGDGASHVTRLQYLPLNLSALQVSSPYNHILYHRDDLMLILSLSAPHSNHLL